MRKLLLLSAVAIIGAPAHAQPARQPSSTQQPVTFTVTGTFSDGSTRDVTSRMYYVTADADSDGDGKLDEGILTLQCPSGSAPPTAAFVIAPLDSASGMASGKRQYQPLIVRKLPDGSSAPAPTFKGSWDLATAKGSEKVIV